MTGHYKLDPAAASTFGSQSLAGCESFDIADTNQEAELTADGVVGVQAIHIYDCSMTVTVTIKDPTVNIEPGTVGSLVLKGALVPNGAGAGEVATATFTNAVFKESTRTVNHDPSSTQAFTFRVPYKTNGTLSPLAWT